MRPSKKAFILWRRLHSDIGTHEGVESALNNVLDDMSDSELIALAHLQQNYFIEYLSDLIATTHDCYDAINDIIGKCKLALDVSILDRVSINFYHLKYNDLRTRIQEEVTWAWHSRQR